MLQNALILASRHINRKAHIIITFNPSCLNTQGVIATERCERLCRACWNVWVAFKHYFLYLRSKCFPLKEAHYLSDFEKVCQRFASVLVEAPWCPSAADISSWDWKFNSELNFAILLCGYNEEPSKFKSLSCACINKLNPMLQICVPVQQTLYLGHLQPLARLKGLLIEI